MKLRTLLQKWVEGADNENLQEICKPETLLQARKRKQTPVKGNLENMFLQCPKPVLQQISHSTERLELAKGRDPSAVLQALPEGQRIKQ